MTEAGARRAYWARRLTRNIGIAMVSMTLGAAVFAATRQKPSLAYRWSMATGYASVVLIGAALMLGPWWLHRQRPTPASTDVRRDIGLWGAGYAVAHVLTGLEVHAGGKWSHYFFWWPLNGHSQPLRLDGFGLANWTGLAATGVLILLAAISNDVSLRALGTSRWKAVQRWTYPAAILVVLHGFAYQVMDSRGVVFVAVFAALILIVLAAQLWGRRLWKRSRS